MRARRFAPFVEMTTVTGMANGANRLASGYRVAIDKQFEL